MIRIRKPAKPPKILRRAARVARQKLCAAFLKASAAYRSGKKRFDFDRAIYAHPEVKEALIRAQHGKCAYCESKLHHIGYGDVEHFRPKAEVRQSDGFRLETPGYYWLAYEWSNLFVSCQLCNQRHKKNWFPLRKAMLRARSHHHDLSQEEPLLVHPSDHDPEQFVSFREEVPYAVRGNLVGRMTIKVLALDRTELDEERWDWLEKLKLIRDLAEENPRTPTSKKAAAFLRRAVHDSSRYASMARAFLKKDHSP